MALTNNAKNVDFLFHVPEWNLNFKLESPQTEMTMAHYAEPSYAKDPYYELPAISSYQPHMEVKSSIAMHKVVEMLASLLAQLPAKYHDEVLSQMKNPMIAQAYVTQFKNYVNYSGSSVGSPAYATYVTSGSYLT